MYEKMQGLFMNKEKYSFCIKKYFVRILLTIFILAMFLSYIPATTYAHSAKNNVILRIGYTDCKGFIERSDDGSYYGYAVDYLNKIAEYTGWKYEYVYNTWEKQMEALENGEIDFICQAEKTPERENKFLFSKYSFGSESNMLYIRIDDDRYFYNDYENFNGMNIAVIKGSYQNLELQEYEIENGIEFNYYECDTAGDCFEALDNEMVDAVGMGSLIVNNGYKVISQIGSYPFYVISGKMNSEIMDQMDKAMAMILGTDPSYTSELFDKYYDNAIDSNQIVFTKEQSELIKSAGKIEVAIMPDRAPFSYLDNNKPVGIIVDILDRIKELSGLQLEYTMMKPGEKVLEYQLEHKDALVAGVLSSNQKYKNGEYLLSDVMYSDEAALVCKKNITKQIYNENSQFSLGIPQNYEALQGYIQKKYPNYNIHIYDSTEMCLDALLKDEVQFIVQNKNIVRPYLQNPHYEAITVLPTYLMDEDMSIMGLNTDKNQVLMEILDKCISNITVKEKNQYTDNETLKNSYHLSLSDMIYKFRIPFAAIVVLIACIVIMLYVWFHFRKINFIKLQEKNRQLGEAVAQANSANRAKSQFLARMSHEIRTPMNAIVGLTAIAEHHKEEPEKMSEYLEKITTASKILLNIINDVLDMSAIESDKIKIGSAPFDLEEILSSIATIYNEQCRKKGINFEMDVSEINNTNVIGDGLRLNQILLNLISNAYKFTPEGGTIVVKAKELSSKENQIFYNFVVADNGEGMSEEMQKRLFKPFEQENAQTANRHGGSGLGLSIAKNLIDMMGGSISFTSEKGKGTTFNVSLPLEIDDNAIFFDKEDEQTLIKSDKKKEYDFEGRKILLAEDTDFNAEIVVELLALVNIHVDRAQNGKEAVEKFNCEPEGTYMAILMDIQMPEMNGYEATKAIRNLKREDAKKIPIIAMTANAFSEDVSAAINAGMNGHIAKPIDTVLLYEKLYNLIK